LGQLVLRGRVFTGKGEGTKFINLRWVKRQIEEKLGFQPYPGTLNIRLDDESLRRRKMLPRERGVEILPPKGFCVGILFRARLGKVEGAVVVPEVTGYPEDVIEVISSLNMREELNLADGDTVEVEVNL
jgi:riboflavin kinase